jgi:steroid delta-isomerase-like uncharacterized protein
MDGAELVRRWFHEVWNEGKKELIDELMAPDCVAHGLGHGGRDLIGPEGFKEFYHRFQGAFPDTHITVEDVFAVEDRVAARWVAAGTHQGEHLGLPASGQPFRVTGMTIVRYRDGRIVEGWNQFDTLGLLQQIGALPSMQLLA